MIIHLKLSRKNRILCELSKQVWTGHSGNKSLVAFSISHTKRQKRIFGGFMDFFVWNVVGAY
jgi:hypothetical protein